MITIRKVIMYKTEAGVEPVPEWIRSLDGVASRRVSGRINRFREGNLGDHKSLGGGLYESRIFFGPGYRLYYFLVNGEVVLLLCGGSKAKQQKDIICARKYMDDYKKRYL